MQVDYIFLKLRTVSPINIGCAEVYEPTSFYMDYNTRELVHFDIGKFIELLSDNERERLSAICKQGTPASIIQLMKFIQTTSQDLAIDGSRILASNGFLDHHKRTLSISTHDKNRVNREINQFQIMRTSFDPLTEKSYIPGSAIKGAIRTAVLNLRRKNADGCRFTGRYAGRNLEEVIFGYEFPNLAADPFRLVKVSDFFPAGKCSKRIVYAIDKKKRPNKHEPGAPYQILEIIEPESEFVGLMAIYQPVKRNIIKQPLTKDEIIEALKTFYGKEKQREEKELSRLGVTSPQIDKGVPLRLGRHSGAECVTIEGYRHIKIMQGKGKSPKFKDHATTIWLSSDSRRPQNNSNLKPFGWTSISETDFESWISLTEYMDSFRKDIYLDAEKQLAQKLKIMKEEAKKREEEAKRREEKKRLEADPEFQRKKKLKEFEATLPDSAKFPGEAASIVEKIRKVDDLELQIQMVNILKKQYKAQIKKAMKKKKKWALAFKALEKQLN